MRLSCVLGTVVACVALQCAGADAPAAIGAAGARKEFAKYKCAYTLPGPDWTYQDAALVPGAIFLANNTAGITVVLTASPCVEDVSTPGFIKGIEQGMLESGDSIKRAGRQMTFKGVAAYEMDTTLKETKQTVASRFFVTHGYAYTLQAIGDETPVEKLPGFDAMMDGFSFTVPPTAPTGGSKNRSAAYESGRFFGKIVMYVFFGLVIVMIVKRVRG